jgi:hypothetical protein
MILVRENPLLGPLEGAGPENLFYAQTALASLVAISGPKKVSTFRAYPLPLALEMDLTASKIIKSRAI